MNDCDVCVECGEQLTDANRDDFSDVCWPCQDKPGMPKMPVWPIHEECSDGMGQA